MKSLKKIAIVVVNYKTPELVNACLDSLIDAVRDFNIEVFVGDAESQDGSVEIISDHITRENLTWATCFAIGRNGGFAFGNNELVKRCILPDLAFDCVYFLNPDTYIRPGAVHALLRVLDDNPAVGIVGSRLENPDGSLRSFGFRAPAPWREFFRGARFSLFDRLVPKAPIKIDPLLESREVDWVTGASFMVRRSMLDDIGLMDDGYFLYFEETDLMTRARNAGYGVWHVADSHVVHLAGQSTGVRNDTQNTDIEPLSPFWVASRMRYLRKHYGEFGALRANVFFLMGDMVYRVHRLLRGRRIENPPHLWRTYLTSQKGGR